MRSLKRALSMIVEAVIACCRVLFFGHPEAVSQGVNEPFLRDLFYASVFRTRSVRFFRTEVQDPPLRFCLTESPVLQASQRPVFNE